MNDDTTQLTPAERKRWAKYGNLAGELLECDSHFATCESSVAAARFASLLNRAERMEAAIRKTLLGWGGPWDEMLKSQLKAALEDQPRE